MATTTTTAAIDERHERGPVGPEAGEVAAVGDEERRRARRRTARVGSISSTSPASENTSAATNHGWRASAPAAGSSAAAATTSAASVAGLQTYSTRFHGADDRSCARAIQSPTANTAATTNAMTGHWVHDPTPCQTGRMAFHHVAITTNDLDATHRFYTEAMGFELVKVEAQPTDARSGWARHLFYDTGNGEMLAVWDIHDEMLDAEYRTEISTGLGLPPWANHIAFDSPDLDDLELKLEALDRLRPRLRAHRPRLVHVDLRRRSERHHGGVLHVDARVHRRRPRRGRVLRSRRRSPSSTETEPEVEFFTATQPP